MLPPQVEGAWACAAPAAAPRTITEANSALRNMGRISSAEAPIAGRKSLAALPSPRRMGGRAARGQRNARISGIHVVDAPPARDGPPAHPAAPNGLDARTADRPRAPPGT